MGEEGWVCFRRDSFRRGKEGEIRKPGVDGDVEEVCEGVQGRVVCGFGDVEGRVVFDFEQEADACGGGCGIYFFVRRRFEKDVQGEFAPEVVLAKGGCWEGCDGAAEEVAGD